MNQITCPHCADTYPDFDVAHVCSRGPYAPKLKPKTNERIKELAIQAEIYAGELIDEGADYDQYPRYYTEKFAELIIQECAGLAKSKSEHIQSMLTDDRGDRRQIDSLAWQFEEFGYEIKKHFGVEE
jgi:hypothetical protein